MDISLFFLGNALKSIKQKQKTSKLLQRCLYNTVALLFDQSKHMSVMEQILTQNLNQYAALNTLPLLILEKKPNLLWDLFVNVLSTVYPLFFLFVCVGALERSVWSSIKGNVLLTELV